MRRIVGMGWVYTALVVAAWRGISELFVRRQALAATGELDRRIAVRRRARIDAALVRVGLLEPQRVLVPVRAGFDDRVHAAVHVGGVRASDPDDVGLLEAAMRRTARERAAIGKAVVVELRPDHPDWGSLLEQPLDDTPVAPIDRDSAALPAWAVPVAIGAVVLTLVALVRPLGDGAPWLAIAGLAIAVGAWLAVRRPR